MARKYIFPVILAVITGIILLILPEKEPVTTTPQDLLKEINTTARFLTPDDIAARMIEKDPSLLLVDVRSQEEFSGFSLPGAVNIPVREMISPDKREILGQEGMDVVFISNGTLLSDQAWILARRMGLKNAYIMKGGLNQWFENFFMSSGLREEMSATELELHQFRKGVRQFFTGGEIKPAGEVPKENMILVPKTKKSAAEGGC